MDNIFTLIVIIIAVVSFARKIKAKQKAQQGATPPGGGGWITKINAFLADIQAKVEQQSQAGATGSSGWSELQDGDEAPIAQSDTTEAGLDDLVFEEEQTPPRPIRRPPVPPGRTQKRRPDREQIRPGIPQRSVLCADRRELSRVARSRAGLRKAVVWSEILGPPVALKDQVKGRW